MTLNLPNLIFLAGLLQLSILCAVPVVPKQLQWKLILAPLPRLIRQMFWTYCIYTLGAITFHGILCLIASDELATTRLGHILCVYLMLFWTARLLLQLVFDVKAYMTNWFVITGDIILTIIFLSLTVIFFIASFRLV